MPTRADLEAHQGVLARVKALAAAALVAWWQRLDVSDPAGVQEAADEFLPALVDMYGGVAGTATADWYSRMRDDAGVPGSFKPHPAATVPDVQVQASARWATAPLSGDDPDPQKALSRMDAATDRYVAQAARDTVAQNTARDPADARWARVPTGTETCAFCMIMASRGAVYESEGTAGGDQNARFIGDGMHKYHDFCDCIAVPVWRGQPLPEGYDPDALYQKYNDAREKAAGSSLQSIAKQMREDLGVK